MKNYLLLIIVGAAVLGMTLSASADREDLIHGIVSKEVGSEDGPIGEPVIEPICIDDLPDDVIIAPNPDAVVEHDADDGERSGEDMVIAPAPHTQETGEESIDTSAATGSVGIQIVNGSGAQVVVVIGALVVLILCAIVARKK